MTYLGSHKIRVALWSLNPNGLLSEQHYHEPMHFIASLSV